MVKTVIDNSEENALIFRCGHDELVGVHHVGDPGSSMGILFIVGGRQYRTGAHRQFTLLARELSRNGYPAFRFDVRGMGDSSGEPRNFLELDNDIRSALEAFRKQSPQLKTVLLWGLCDGASAAIVSASTLPLVGGVIMVNPWITTDDSAAKVQLKHYYRDRAFSNQFWRKMLSGNVNWWASIAPFVTTLAKALVKAPKNPDTVLPDIVFDEIERFNGKVYIIISKHDITAREFEEEYIHRSNIQNYGNNNTSLHRVMADHTFSAPEQHDQLSALTLKFILSLQKLSP